MSPMFYPPAEIELLAFPNFYVAHPQHHGIGEPAEWFPHHFDP
jgi:hypothetical protein